MKKLTFMLSALCLLVISSCSKDTEITQEQAANPNFRVTEYSTKSGSNFLGNRTVQEFADATPCYSTDLIAGQNTIVGTVSVYKNADEMFIQYSITDPTVWSIQTTHLSVGDCVQTIPTTGSGNPKVGQFEKAFDHTIYGDGATEVIYQFSQDVYYAAIDYYCFAAHAVVQGPTNETAWAGGSVTTTDVSTKGFDGNSWATYIEAALSNCPTEADTDGDGVPDGQDSCQYIPGPATNNGCPVDTE